MISDITTLHALNADQKNVNLYSEIDDALPGFVVGDPTRIRQILVNLISNALKFTEKGEVCVRLKLLSHDAANAVVRIEISDTGVGIEEVTLDKLFNAFTQADGSTTRKYGGTGLGLAIVKQLVNLMRGKLGVESEPRKGSTFWFEIPLGVAQSGLKKKPVDAAREKRHLPNARILLAEDNPVNQMVACKMLEKLGLQTVVAANGNLALKQLETEEFDAVLMDCQMPEMDGFAATRILRDYERQMSKAAHHCDCDDSKCNGRRSRALSRCWHG